MRHAALSVLALGLAAALAACATPPADGSSARTRTHSVVVTTIYQPSEIRAGGAPFPVEVRGTPPDGSDAAAVAAALTLPRHLGGAPLATAEPGQRGPRLVIAFGGAPLNRFCDRGAGGTALAADARLVAVIGICRNGRLMARGITEAPGTRGPADEAFAAAMMQGMLATLPTRNPNVDGTRPGRRVPGG